MSEKVTFQELIESIAEETNKSKQFTHDFLKDFVDVINTGLKQDETVNIAGFGKFKLRQMDEREGYNPQTEEKMTIPAHNKVVFKPYKNLRELVNAPYSHLEPELIEEDSNSSREENDSDKNAAESPVDEQDDFIPTAPPTSRTSTRASEGDEITGDEDPFAFEKEKEKSESSDDTGDIVEFTSDKNLEHHEEFDEELDEFLRTPAKSGKTTDDNGETDESEKAPNADAISALLFGEKKDQQQAGSAKPSAGKTDKPSSESTSSMAVILAATLALLLAAGGVWYFGILSNHEVPQLATKQTAPPAVDKPEGDQPAQSTHPNREEDSQKKADKKQGAGKTSNSDESASSSTSEKEVKTQIEKGQTLWSLAEEKYGNPRLWPWIYGNNNSLKDPDLIFAGSSLSVPLPSGPHNNLNRADSIGVAKGYIATYHWYKGHKLSKARNHLWAAKLYHHDIRSIANVKIDKADLTYANQTR